MILHFIFLFSSIKSYKAMKEKNQFFSLRDWHGQRILSFSNLKFIDFLLFYGCFLNDSCFRCVIKDQKNSYSAINSFCLILCQCLFSFTTLFHMNRKRSKFEIFFLLKIGGGRMRYNNINNANDITWTKLIITFFSPNQSINQYRYQYLQSINIYNILKLNFKSED